MDEPADPVILIMIASLMRDDFPWLYEVAMAVHRTVMSREVQATEEAFTQFRHAVEITKRMAIMEQFGVPPEEVFMALERLPMILDYVASRIFEWVRR
jgi:hypothetical protein